MWKDNPITARLQIKWPLIQAGMAGGTTTPELVAAVSEAGGLGTLGAGYMSAEQIRQSIRTIRELTDKPFGVNLFIPEAYDGEQPVSASVAAVMNGVREGLGIPLDPVVARFAEPFEEQMAVVLEEQVPVFSFTFGVLEPRWLAELKQRGVTVIGTATTVREAVALEASGVDMIAAQGTEAGGHRGSFLPDSPSNLVGTMALVPQIVDRVNIPVIAAGGIMDGRGMVAAFALGAQAVQMGTAFLTCVESGAHPAYKREVRETTDEATVITRAFSGKAARGIQNEFMTLLAPLDGELPPYPVQNALTRDIRTAAAKQDRTEFLSLWAGQAASLSRGLRAAELVAKLVEEAEHVYGKLR
ncbi:NAD(P)H-dependent flavin oxidoreductase [Brevibacillus choshinensis]|uniref:Probable nitronate monooxygenase n=1 Tax=Brevibacillus choshinensis TaxID=54911 RepID=A0ABX7FY49_BRECH|nr:nitronate monooxygenase [Brevibacillus choshinensis]QRG70739.1 nitronate monooxygenase [Brevibacillus choshinensis]